MGLVFSGGGETDVRIHHFESALDIKYTLIVLNVLMEYISRKEGII